MARSLDQLLPAPDDAPRCAEHARSIAVDPGGTAIRADRVVLVTVPQPWPKPALDHPLLRDLRPLFAASPVTTRLLAAVPAEGATPAGGPVTVAVYDRDGGSALERRFAVEPDELVPWAELLAAEPPPGRTGSAAASAGGAAQATARLRRWQEGETEQARPAVLICTQGSHDICCGSDGVRFAAEVDSSLDVTVHRVSHTGGHRFAPTAMTLPDGRMWADLDLDALRRILAAVGDASEVADRCRGWWGADTGPAQIAERAVLAAEGWALDDEDRTVTVTPLAEGADPTGDTSGIGPTDRTVGAPGIDDTDRTEDRVRCTVTAGAGRWVVEVRAGRAVPTIACRQPGGRPAKEAREYEVVTLARVPAGAGEGAG